VKRSIGRIYTQISQNTIVIVIDAYLDFTKQQSLSNIVNDHKILLSPKRFRKHGLAGRDWVCDCEQNNNDIWQLH
jgi:histidinol-phosphate aminotransferase